MDLKFEMGSDKASSACSESGPGSGSGSKQVKSCSDCKTTKTPLWRGGPSGPKTLCNACGIKYNKKRRQKLGVAKKDKGKSKKSAAASAAVCGGGSGRNGGLGESLKRKLVELGGEILLKGKRSGKVLSSLREEEQAAMLLMALSCGSVNA